MSREHLAPEHMSQDAGLREPKPPPRGRRHGYAYSEDTNEPAKTLSHEPVEVEREVPAAAEDNPSVERLGPRDAPPPPHFEED